MIDIDDLLEGTAIVGLMGYILISILSTALIVGIELWVLWNFFDLLAWAEQFGMITLPLQAGIAVVALAGLSIAVPVVIIATIVVVGAIGMLLD